MLALKDFFFEEVKNLNDFRSMRGKITIGCSARTLGRAIKFLRRGRVLSLTGLPSKLVKDE